MSLAADTYHEFELPPNLLDDRGILTIDFINLNETSLLFLGARDLGAYEPQRKHKASEIEGLIYRLLFCGWLCGKLTLAVDGGGAEVAEPAGSLALLLDETNREVRVGDQLVELTPREFDLLAELIRHKGAVLTRDLLVERVWGFDFAGDTRTVDVHVRALREKIERDPANPRHLQTIWGVGYKFEP